MYDNVNATLNLIESAVNEALREDDVNPASNQAQSIEHNDSTYWYLRLESEPVAAQS